MTSTTSTTSTRDPPLVHLFLRVSSLTALTLGLLLLLPGIALAHASFDVRQLPTSSTQDLVLRVPLERDAANARVEVLAPGAFTVESCDASEGWSCEQTETTEGDTVLTLERGADGAGDTERFALMVTTPAEEGVYAFPTIQTYDDGEEAAWIGEQGTDRPAPRIQVGDSTTEVEFSGEATPHTDTVSPSPSQEVSPSGPPSPTAPAPDAPSGPSDAGAEEAATDDAGAEEDGGLPLVPVVVGALAAVAAIGLLVARTR